MQDLKVHLGQDGAKDGARARGRERNLTFYSLFILIYSVGYHAVDLMIEFLSFIPI